MNWTWLAKFALGLAGEILLYILGRLREKKIFDQALALAEEHCRNLDKADESVSNEDKRRMAAESLKESLKRLGYELKDTMLNLAIEMAVNKLRREAGIAGEK